MGEGDSKKALVVEDHAGLLKMIGQIIEKKGYEITLINYLETQEIPEDEFDLLIVDGLGGKWERVWKDVNAKRKILYSGTDSVITNAKRDGNEAYLKPVDLSKILEDVQ